MSYGGHLIYTKANTGDSLGIISGSNQTRKLTKFKIVTVLECDTMSICGDKNDEFCTMV